MLHLANSVGRGANRQIMYDRVRDVVFRSRLAECKTRESQDMSTPVLLVNTRRSYLPSRN